MPNPEKLADNAWLRLSERAAVYILLAGLAFVGNMIDDLASIITAPDDGLVAKVAEVRTVQNKAIVPSLVDLRKGLTIVTDNLLNHPRFDKNDAERLDDKHLKIMEGLDARLRELEGRGPP